MIKLVKIDKANANAKQCSYQQCSRIQNIKNKDVERKYFSAVL